MKDDCGLCRRYGRGCQYHPDDGEPGSSQHGSLKRCGAPRRSDKQPCTKRAGWGTDHVGYGHCRHHCGNTPSGRKAAQKEMAQEAVVIYGLPIEVEPHLALLQEVHRTAGHVAYLQQRVQETSDPDDLVWGLAEETIGGQYAGVTSKAAPNIWLTLYMQERKHLVDVCRVALAAGVAERQVRLAEQQGHLIARVIRGVLKDQGLEETPKVAQSVRRHLMLVDGLKGEAA